MCNNPLTYELSPYSGILIDNAMDLIPHPPWSAKQMSQYYDRAMTDALKYGLTSIHDALVYPKAIEFFKK